MGRLLFITNRNILTTCGELRLIKNRAEVLYRIYRVPSDFIVLASKKRIQEPNKEKIEAGGEITEMELSQNNPIKALSACWQLEKCIEKKLKTHKYSMVVLSGLLMPAFAKKIKKKYQIPVVFDIHGALEDTKEVVSNAKLLRKMIFYTVYQLENFILKKAFGYADGCLVVTEALKNYLIERYPTANKIEYYIVPCATDSVEITKDDYRRYRIEYREKYGITSEEKVFVYSGGVSVWQCIDETIALYKALQTRLNQPTKMFLFSHDYETIKKKVGEDKNFIIDSYTPNELQKVLCAADVAFLLRKECPTNRVAFPNKFLEYVKSGLSIITTPYVEEISRQVQENDIGYIYGMDQKIGRLLKVIKSDKQGDFDYEKVEKIILRNSFENRLKSFAKRCKDV